MLINVNYYPTIFYVINKCTFMFHCRNIYSYCSSSEDFNWKETRRFVKSCIEEFLSGKGLSKCNDTTARIFSSVLLVNQSAVVIVHDNLPLRSMSIIK